MYGAKVRGTYAIQLPPHETDPAGVYTRLGFIFGQFILCLGSTGNASGSAVKNPTETTISFAVRKIFSNCSLLNALFFATNSKLSGR